MCHTEIKIRPGDLVSGSTYLKLVEDYKAYDARQKSVIKRLQTDIDFLMFENPDYQKRLRSKYELETLRRTVARLRKDNERLLCKLLMLDHGSNSK